MDGSAFVTIATRNYLHYARALCNGLRELHPEIPAYVCVIDDARDVLRPDEPFTPIFACDLGIEDWKRFLFQYQAHEVSCALKPFAMEHLLSLGYSKVCYLDSDMQVYGSFSDILHKLNTSDIVITPHLHAPDTEEADPPLAEQSVLSAGIFNGGFLGVNDSENALSFLNWWKGKHRRWCILDVEANLHADQRWLDLIPVYFENIHVERAPQYNVAYWNIHQRHLEKDQSHTWLVNGEPLIFFHFSGWDAKQPSRLSRFGNPYDASKSDYLSDLFSVYRDSLIQAGQVECTKLKYEYSQLSDGTPIRPLWREAIRVNLPQFAECTDPFDVESNPSLKRLFKNLPYQRFANRKSWRHDQLNRFRKHPFIAPLWQLFQRFERSLGS